MPEAISHYAVVGAELAISWSDGGETYIPLEALRRACPCAACNGEPDAMGRVVAPPKPALSGPAFTLAQLAPVGGYALQPVWGDGHRSGIYPFAYLRKLGEENTPP